MSDHLNRIFIWCVPRTVSTAFLKCLSFVEGVQAVNEPYACAFSSGPERKNPDLVDVEPTLREKLLKMMEYARSCPENHGYDEAICTYHWVRSELLDAPYSDKKILISKDMAHAIDGKYDMLPQGFKYSFLIRHPAKVFSSWKKSFAEIDGTYEADLRKLPDVFFPKGYGFKELYDLVEYVEKTLGHEAVIIDTDDLLSDPPGILSAYCHKMDIPYSPELLSWDAGPGITEKWIMSRTFINLNKAAKFYDTAFASSAFKAPTPRPPTESLPDDVRACVCASMGYYEKLYDRRIKPLPTA